MCVCVDDANLAIALRKGKFYKLDVVSEHGCVLPPVEIKKHLEKIVKMAGGQ